MSFSSSHTSTRRTHNAATSFTTLLLFLSCLLSSVTSRAIMGVDLGSSYMKVALVRPGKALEIVTNLHSKRKTEMMILFDNGQRFYGADANALLARKSAQTPVALPLVLGRSHDHPVAQVLKERYYPITPLFNETRKGVQMEIPKAGTFTPEELTAMVLQHATHISQEYAISAGGSTDKPKDIVITVPSFCKDTERRSIVLAAQMAGLNVLSLVDETVAAALQYAMDKDFSVAEDGTGGEQVVLFYNMGASSTQVVMGHFFNYEQPQKYGKSKSVPALQVVAKTWDETVGGAAFDHRLAEYLATQLNAKLDNGQDVRLHTRTMTKLRLEANKIKHVLSANTERPVSLDHEGVHLSLTITREQFQDLCKDLMEKAVAPVAEAIAQAKTQNITLTSAQVLGGGMRIPSVQQKVESLLAKSTTVSLDKHMNADEAMALGAAFFGANISTAFRVRSVGMTDLHPWAIGIDMHNLETETTTDEAEEPWSKKATIFKAWGKVGVKKTIAFTHDEEVHAGLSYVDDNAMLEQYNVTGIAAFAKEMEQYGSKPKVSLQFELSSSGIASLIKAEAAVEEVYTVEEEVEVDDDEDETAEEEGTRKTTEEEETPKEEAEEAKEEDKKEEEAKKDDEKEEETSANETTTEEGEAKNETKEEAPKKKKKTIKVEKEKKKIHKKTLTVERYFVGPVQPLSKELMEESKAKLAAMDLQDNKRILLEEARNKYEGYIYKVKNQLMDNEEAIAAVTNEKQREEMSKLASAAEEWLDDEGYKADLATTEDKYAELSVPFEKIVLRMEESTLLPESLEKMRKVLTDVEAMMEKWVEEKPQVTEKERKEVLKKVEEVRKWADGKEKKQSKKKPHEDPVFLSTEIPEQMSPLRQKIKLLSKRPKPKPKVEKVDLKKNATDAKNATEDDKESTTDEKEESSTATDEEKTKAPDTTPTTEEEEKTEEIVSPPSDEEAKETVADEL